MPINSKDAEQEREAVKQMISPGGNRRKRKLLIVEDMMVTREILASMLDDEFEILMAEDGEQGYRVLTDNFRDISVVMLDMYMPVMNGFEFLLRLQNDSLLSSMPVIVTTGSDQLGEEARCLEMGAADFLTKPYSREVVRSRVHRAVELHESVAALKAIEYDEVTGLYTKQAFMHHARVFMDSSESDMFMFSARIENMSIINQTYGEQQGDRVLSFVGRRLADGMPYSIGYRKGNHYIFIGSLSGYTETADDWKIAASKIQAEAPISNIVMKYSLYMDIDKTLSVQGLLDRLQMAAESIRGDYTKNFAVYDETIARRKLQEQQLEENFHQALADGEFQVWFQPKFDVKTEKIIGAEALVRWIDSEGNVVSPSEFIPPFERDGLIADLDEYVFRNVCELQKKHIEMGHEMIPISVNLSGGSLYSPGTIRKYENIVSEAGIDFKMVPLELPESIAQDDKNIGSLMGKLVEAGFEIHLDDFGAGDSSLPGLCTLPFSVIKLDKKLVDHLDIERGYVLIGHMIDTIHALGMQVIAEGAETVEQVDRLRESGCDVVQGFYYSKPVDRETFEKRSQVSIES